jgi:predicted ATPase
MHRSKWAGMNIIEVLEQVRKLLQQQGKTDEAHKLLSEIYNWFTEGFDTADLKDAKVLLEELAG